MVVQHNLQAYNANRMLGNTTNQVAKSTEKLSSGYKINRAADDAAGLAISEKMRKQIRGLDRAARNVEEGISFVQTADGALNEVGEMLQRISELAIKSANGTNSLKDREAIDLEVQQIKAEMERVFETTEFNEKLIWPEPTSETVINAQKMGVEKAVSLNNYLSSQRILVDNENYQYMPVCAPYIYHDKYNIAEDYTSYFTLNAKRNSGISFSWTAFNGNTYVSDTISWHDLEMQGNQVNIGSLLSRVTYEDVNGNTGTTTLVASNGNPLIDFDISISKSIHATGEDLEKALDGTKITYYTNASLSANVNTFTSSDIRIYSASMTAAAAYADRMEAENRGLSNCFDYTSPSSNDFVSNNAGNFSESMNGLFSFSFSSEGLGALTATCTYIGYNAGSEDKRYPAQYSNIYYDDDDEGIWWRRRGPGSFVYGSNRYTYRYDSLYYPVNNVSTVEGIKQSLLGGKNSSSVGVLTEANGGATDGGGYIYLSFDLKSDIPYEYGKNENSNNVGEIVVEISVSKTDTVDSVFQKIRNVMNSNTVMSLTTRYGNSQVGFYDKENYVSSDIEKREVSEVYDFSIDFNIHSGSEVEDKIYVEYDSLRLKYLGMENSNVLTETDALKCIDEVSWAITLVNKERSRFGSYQNRMMHAYSIDKISQENTQAGESQIRDTDFANEMVKNANANILKHAGQAMLAQANQSNEIVLNLLRQ